MRFSVQTWFYLLTDKHTFCTWTHESSVLSWSGSNTVRLFKLMVNSLKTHQWCNDMDVCMELIMSTKLQETWHTKFLQELKCFSTDSYYLCVLQSLSRLCVSVTITKCFCLWQAEVFVLTLRLHWMDVSVVDSSGTVLLRCLSSINTHWLRFESVTSQHCWTAACEAEKFQH